MSMLTSNNYALAFDGVNDIVRANQVVGMGPLTIEAWVRPTTSNANGLVIVGADDNTGWSLELNDGHVTLWLATNQGWQFNQHSTALQAGQWYHIAATYEAGFAQTFVNGVGSGATSVGTLTQGPHLRFGGVSASYAYFAGVLDEVRISNIVRYTANFTPPAAPFSPDTNTRGLWHLNEGAGQIANDASTLANHGTLGNSSGTDSADPVWTTGYPFAGTPTPTSTNTPTRTNTPTATPTNTPTPTPTLPPNSYQLIDAAVARGEITLDQATTYKVYALFGSPQSPTQYQSTELIPDEGTAALLYALQDWNQLSPATQQIIADFITPKQVTQGASGPLSSQSASSNAPRINNQLTSTPSRTATRAVAPSISTLPTSTPTRTPTKAISPSSTPLLAQTPPAVAVSKMPVMFVENVGQFDTVTKFRAQGNTALLDLAEDGITLTMVERSKASMLSQRQIRSTKTVRQTASIKLTFVGANPHPIIEPFTRLNTRVSYFIGNDKTKWQSNVPVWGGVRYKDLYPGIDLEITSEGGQLIQRLVARTGANPNAVRWQVTGANQLAIEPSRLRLTTNVGQVTLPLLQLVAADGKSLAQSLANPTLNGNEIIAPFAATGSTTNNRMTTLDTPTDPDLLYLTFWDLGSQEYATNIAVDQYGAAYVTGVAWGSAVGDVLVIKLDSTGTLVYAGVFGGSDTDIGRAIAVDSAGAVYVAGETYSAGFPIVPVGNGGFTGYEDAFVTKFDSAGNIVYSTLMGGSDYSFSFAEGIAVDASGAAYVTGTAGENFLGTVTTAPGFLVKLNSAGTLPPVYTVSLSVGQGSGLALDNQNAAYVVGWNNNDVFAAKFDATGNPIYVQTLGGSNWEWADRVAVDANGNAYIVGSTTSSDFGTGYHGGTCYDNIEGGSTPRPCYDAFIVKLDALGATNYIHLLGGDGDEYSNGIVRRSTGEIFVTGSTDSATWLAPRLGGEDAFVIGLDATWTQIYQRILGGTAYDSGDGLAIDSTGAMYVAGTTTSPDFSSGADLGDNVFIAKLAAGVALPTPTPTATATPTNTPTATATWTPTATPTVTPNVGGWPYADVASCRLNRQYLTTHFVIWYADRVNLVQNEDCRIFGANPDTYLQELGNGLERALAVYSSLGFQLPAPLPNQRYQVYVLPVWASGKGIAYSPNYIFVSNNATLSTSFPETVLKYQALAAHEFFHTVQWTYQKQTNQQPCPQIDPLQVTWAWFWNEDLRWWMESTAQWAQHQAIDQGWASLRTLPPELTYTDGVREYFEKPGQHIDTRPRYIGFDNFGYSPLFPFYLVERIGAAGDARNIIRNTWEEYQRTGNCGNMIPAIQRTLPANQQIEQTFPSFAETNYVLAYQEQADIRTKVDPFQDGGPNDVRPLHQEERMDTLALVKNGPPGNFAGKAVDRLGATYIEFDNRFDRNHPVGLRLTINLDVYINLNEPPLPDGAVKLLVINDWTPPNVGYSTILPVLQFVDVDGTNLHYTTTVDIANFDSKYRVTLVLSNPRTNAQVITYSYSAVVQ